MAFSFDPTLPTPRDEFRARLDDVFEQGATLSNEVVDALILKFGLPRALLSGCNTIILRLAKKVSSLTSASGARFAWSERVKAYQALKEELLAEAGEAEWTDALLDEYLGGGSGNVTTLSFPSDHDAYLEIYPYHEGCDPDAWPEGVVSYGSRADGAFSLH